MNQVLFSEIWICYLNPSIDDNSICRHIYLRHRTRFDLDQIKSDIFYRKISFSYHRQAHLNYRHIGMKKEIVGINKNKNNKDPSGK